MLFDGTPVGGRIPVPGVDGSTQQWPQLRTSGGRGHQEARVQEAQVPAGQGAEGVHHAGYHYERVHCVLVTVLRAGAGQAVPQRPVQHTQLAEQPVPMVGLRQLATEPCNLRDAESRLPKAVPANTVLQVRLAEPHDEGGVLPFAVR